MTGQTVAYVRVSTAEQNLERQLEAVGECDRIFQDKISGRSRSQRTGLAWPIANLREFVRQWSWSSRRPSLPRILGRATLHPPLCAYQKIPLDKPSSRSYCYLQYIKNWSCHA